MDRLNSWCQECVRQYHKEYYQQRKETLKERSRNYNRENLNERLQYQRKWRTANKEHVYKQGQQYRRLHQAEREEYRRLHEDEQRAYQREYIKQRSLVDPLFKFKRRMRSLIRHAFKRKGYSKKSQTAYLLGAEYEYAKNWLEYTWFLNYGTEYSGEKVDIDHIIPNDFAMSEGECIALQHISNLQYLTPADNLAKFNIHPI